MESPNINPYFSSRQLKLSKCKATIYLIADYWHIFIIFLIFLLIRALKYRQSTHNNITVRQFTAYSIIIPGARFSKVPITFRTRKAIL